MFQFTDEVTGCERDMVFFIDALDRDRRLLSEHISLSEPLANSGFGPQKCYYLLIYINKRRQDLGKTPPVKKAQITPATTLRGAIDHVCS